MSDFEYTKEDICNECNYSTKTFNRFIKCLKESDKLEDMRLWSVKGKKRFYKYRHEVADLFMEWVNTTNHSSTKKVFIMK